MNRLVSVDITCNRTPKLNGMRHDKMIPHLRPKKSATNPAHRAPKKVPTDRIETIKEIRLESTPGVPSAWTGALGKNSFRQ